MFTVEQLKRAHSKMKSAEDFSNYIDEIKEIGVVQFVTWVLDGHTVYYGLNNFQTSSKSQYEALTIISNVNKNKFTHYLELHQQGTTGFFAFCNHCAETGIEKWTVNLYTMTCTYFDKYDNEILVEILPSSPKFP